MTAFTAPQDQPFHKVRLPDSAFATRDLRIRDMDAKWFGVVFDEMERCIHSPGWNPRLKRLDGDLHMVDVTVSSADTKHFYSRNMICLPHSVTVIDYVDHLFLTSLPSNAPRAVKSIYRKEVRLKHLRATNYWTVAEDMTKAYAAWADYQQSRRVARDQENRFQPEMKNIEEYE